MSEENVATVSPDGPYFPKAEASPILSSYTKHIPERPKDVGPIFDTDHADTPIEGFDDILFSCYYSDDMSPDSLSSSPPPQPESFSDRYLFPTLAQNERLRLTMLWYYTRHITEDESLMLKLHGMINMVQQFFGWEFALMGILDEASYTRLVTANLPLAILPRRESTCSHTILQKAGTVFMLTNMVTDWRFRHSPHVEIGGLRSYAGTQLRLKADTGQEVALGSICVASNSEQPPLTTDQKAALVRFADMLMAEVVNRTKLLRQGQKQTMADLLAQLNARKDISDINEAIIDTVRQVYTDAVIMVQDSSNNKIHLDGREPIDYTEFQSGLWEDHAFIDSAIRLKNYQQIRSPQPNRAIIGRCGRSSKFLVVASRDIRWVFDDIDAWFIDRCAMALADMLKESSLKEALKAKEVFLRGITHQLRTPIHGILGSAELLTEELATRRLIRPPSISTRSEEPPSSPSSYLTAIKNSGRELMMTVNNMIKLNTWAARSLTPPKPVEYDLDQLESDILADVLQVVPEERLGSVSIVFENKLPSNNCIVTIDAPLLKECLQSLLLNAIQFTRHGSVTVRIYTTNSDLPALCFDVIDTGIGIKEEDHKRIFESYEKVNIHSQGAGLGLTLASKIAHILDGSVILVSSCEGVGSHFCVKFYNPALVYRTECSSMPTLNLKNLPRSFCVAPSALQSPSPLLVHLVKHLERKGFERNEKATNSLVLANPHTEVKGFIDFASGLIPTRIIICIVASREEKEELQQTITQHRLICVSGPFYSNRLDDILMQADDHYGDMLDKVPKLSSALDSMCIGSPGSLCITKATSPPPDPLLPPLSTSLMPRALLVDDNAINLRILRMYCEKRKIPYVLATDGNQAIDQYKLALSEDQPITLTLMDLQMPYCDGIQACAEIRKIEEARSLQPTTIFIVTGQDSAEDRSRSFGAGANEFFVKPVGLKALDRGISRYFKDFDMKR